MADHLGALPKSRFAGVMGVSKIRIADELDTTEANATPSETI